MTCPIELDTDPREPSDPGVPDSDMVAPESNAATGEMDAGDPAPEPLPAGPAHAPLSAPLPEGLPGTVAGFLAAQAIVTRGQAAVCLACLEVEPDLLAGVRLDPDDIRRALDMLRIDVSSAFALMQAQIASRFAVSPPGVPLDAPPEARPGEGMDSAIASPASGRRDLGDLFGPAGGPSVGPDAKGAEASDAITGDGDGCVNDAPESSSQTDDPDEEPRP